VKSSEVHTIAGRNPPVFTGITKKRQIPDLKTCPCLTSSSCLKCGVVRLALQV